MTDLASLGIEFQTRGAADADAQLDAYATKAGKAADAADKLNASAGKTSAGFSEMSRGIANANKTVAETDRTVANMGASLNAAMTRNTAMFDSMRRGVSGVHTEIAKGADAVAKSAGLARYELINLSRQAQDVAVSLGSGQSFGTVLLQQGTQIADVFANSEGNLKGFFEQITSGAARILTPMRLVVGGAASIGAAALYFGYNWQEAQSKVEQSLIGIGARTGTTAADINKFAEANSSATGLSIAAARDVATEFTKTGNITVSSLKGVGDAIHGYSILTGKDATTATKEFASLLGGDLVEAAKKLDQTYGFLNASTLNSIRAFEAQGDRARGIQTILDGISADNRKAADSVGFLTKAYDALANMLSKLKTGPTTLPDVAAQRDAAQKAYDDAATRQAGETNGISRNARGELVSSNDFLVKVDEFKKAAEESQAAFDKVNSDNVVKQLGMISTAADATTHAIIPQIDQIRKLQEVLDNLHAAQMTPGVSTPTGTDSAITAIQNQIDGLKEAQGQADRYNQRVAEISTQWGDVGQSTALALEAAHNQIPVLEAVGGAAKMAAQETADYKNYMDQGKTSTEAAALAASNLAASQAQVNSAAANTLASLRDQYAVASARNPLEAAHAQAQATFNDLLRQGVDSQLAMNIAAQQEANARAAIYVQMEKAVRASRDAVDLAATQGTAEQANVKARIAYNNAIDAGATSTQAAIIANNAGAVAAMQWAEQAQRIAEAYENAARAAEDAKYADAGGSFGNFSPKDGITGSQTDPLPDGYKRLLISHASAPPNATTIANNILATGSVDSAISAIQGLRAGTFTNNSAAGLELSLGYKPGQLGLAQSTTISQSDIISLVGQLYNAKNSQTTDKSVQAANLQQELAWLQSQPQSLETLSAISSLRSSIDSLTKSTDSLNSTNQDLLSPYYSQDPRTSHIGFRSQGMASTGYIDIPGVPSANDNMTLTLPVASGERVNVTNGPNRGGGAQPIIQVIQQITVQGGANQDAVRRTLFQAGQTMGKQLAASRQ